MYKVEYYKYVGLINDRFKNNELYPVRVVRRGDKQVLEDENGLMINIGWKNSISMSAAIDFSRRFFDSNFEFDSLCYFESYKDFKKNREL